MVSSTGDEFCACVGLCHLPAWLDFVTARSRTLRSTLASDQLLVGIIVHMGRSRVPTRYLCRIRADCPYAAAHHADDGRTTFNPARQSSRSVGAGPLEIRGARVCGSIPELATRYSSGKHAHPANRRLTTDGSGDVRLACAQNVRTRASFSSLARS